MTEYSLAALAARLEERGQLVSSPIAADDRAAAIAVGAIRYDSRQVQPGDLFVARRGRYSDGHDHAAAAVAAGATAVVAEHVIEDVGVPQLLVSDARIALAQAAAWRAGDPSHRIGVVGITGTDGKTTTAYLVRAILEAAGRRTGLIGTTDVIVGGRSLGNAARSTTPEAPELQGYLAAMLDSDDTWVVIESTSHGLAQERVGEVAYDVAVLTNITSEHLEFHGTLEAYRAAKRSLFARLAVGPANPDKGFAKHAVVNAADGEAGNVAGTAEAAGARVLRYGLADGGGTADTGGRDLDLDLAATEVEADPSGLRLTLRGRRWQGRVSMQLPGRFNALNALAALGVAEAIGLDLSGAAAALASVTAIPGRMQRLDLGQPFTVVIDYAHTAEALATVLDELAPTQQGTGLIAVFGSAGERDTQKRPAMGSVAGQRCRLVVLTDEDPRREDSGAILEAIAAGAEAAGKRRGDDLLLIADRAEAIKAAMARARPGDVILLAGKGHEATIEMAGGVMPWDEAEAAQAALRSLGYG